MILGAFPSSGLLTADPPSIAKIVGMLIAGLAALNYTAQRTALKRAYLAALGTDSTQLSRVPQIATSALLVAVVATLVITQPSCGTAANCQDPKNAQSAACVVKGAIVDCTGVSSLPSAVAVVTPIIERLIVSATQSDGSIQWSSIEQQIIDLALQYGTCVIAEIWNGLMNHGGGGSGSGSAIASGSGSGASAGSALARPRPSSADLAKEFDRIRARVSPGRQFKISGGKL